MIKEIYYKICNSFSEDWEKKKWVTFAVKLSAYIGASYSVGYLLGLIIELIIEYRDSIAMAIGLVICIGMLILGFFPTEKKKEKKTEQDEVSMITFDPVILESTYYMIRNNICMIIGETADLLKLRKPTVPSQMDLPVHYDIEWKTPIYHLIVRKADDDVDVEDIKGILQTTIQQKSDNHELDGIPSHSSLFCNGMKYPILMVDAVRDLGDSVQVDLAIANEDYIKYRNMRIYSKIGQKSHAVKKDKDF